MKRGQGAEALLSMTILTLNPLVWSLGWVGAEAGAAEGAPHSAEMHASFYLSDVIRTKVGYCHTRRGVASWRSFDEAGTKVCYLLSYVYA